jgi:hypothetical protein
VEQPVIQVVCRDGVLARVQRIPYAGKEGGQVYFGYRIIPGVPSHDSTGMRNESGDLWSLAGRWVDSTVDHAFDIVSVFAKKQAYQNAATV